MRIKLIDYGFSKAVNQAGPVRAHYNDSGADLFAIEDLVLKPGAVTKVKTGLGFCIPDGYDGVVHCKSGLSSRGILASNAPIDSGYRGEVHAILYNSSDEFFQIHKGEKIGQLVIRPVIQADFVWALGDERGAGAFGSTGR